jgi:hypothetical protein
MSFFRTTVGGGKWVLSAAVEDPIDPTVWVIKERLSHSRNSHVDVAVRHIDGTESDRVRVCKDVTWPTTRETIGGILAKACGASGRSLVNMHPNGPVPDVRIGIALQSHRDTTTSHSFAIVTIGIQAVNEFEHGGLAETDKFV